MVAAGKFTARRVKRFLYTDTTIVGGVTPPCAYDRQQGWQIRAGLP